MCRSRLMHPDRKCIEGSVVVFARKGFPNGELGRLLALMLELDHNGLSSLLEPLRKR